MAQKDIEMAKYILSILKSRPMVVMSWGFSSATVIEDGLAFHVNGLKYHGWCQVVYDQGSDTFTFRTTTLDGKVKKQLDDVYLDSLVDVIDMNVETGYANQEQCRMSVENWLEACFS